MQHQATPEGLLLVIQTNANTIAFPLLSRIMKAKQPQGISHGSDFIQALPPLLSPLLKLVLLGVHQAHSDVLVHEEQHGAHEGREEGRPASPHRKGHEGNQPRAADGSGERRGDG